MCQPLLITAHKPLRLLLLPLLGVLLSACGHSALPDKCYEKPESGRCKAYFLHYYFEPAENRCKAFVYGGCGGNVPFKTGEECVQTCGGPVPDEEERPGK